MIAVIGLGFVGLTTALGFCEKGFKVFGYDKDSGRARALKTGRVPFHEPGLDDALHRHLFTTNNFVITDDITNSVEKAELVFYCVGTPGDEHGRVDLSYIYTALKDSLEGMETNYKVLVVKSTVPPSTTSLKIQPFIESLGLRVGYDVGLANNPEFLREGFAWEDFMRPDRVVVGVSDNRSAEMLRKVYATFNAPIHEVSPNTAEFIKYLSNTFLATLVSYSNEMAMVADTIGDIDIPGSFKILHQDRRWNGQPARMTNYVYPGCGYGGYCLPKDTEALCMESAERRFEPQILKEVIKTNKRRRDFLVAKLLDEIDLNDRVGILGLAFKPDSDDIRESPSLYMIESLLAHGVKNLAAYDPLAVGNFRKAFQLPINYRDTLEELVEWADHLVILTAWQEFKANRQLIARKKVHDFRYCL